MGLLGSLGALDRAPSWLVGIGVGTFMLVLIAVALWLFNRPLTDPLGGKTAEEHIRELATQNLLESMTFHAKRAFGVENQPRSFPCTEFTAPTRVWVISICAFCGPW